MGLLFLKWGLQRRNGIAPPVRAGGAFPAPPLPNPIPLPLLLFPFLALQHLDFFPRVVGLFLLLF